MADSLLATLSKFSTNNSPSGLSVFSVSKRPSISSCGLVKPILPASFSIGVHKAIETVRAVHKGFNSASSNKILELRKEASSKPRSPQAKTLPAGVPSFLGCS